MNALLEDNCVFVSTFVCVTLEPWGNLQLVKIVFFTFLILVRKYDQYG